MSKLSERLRDVPDSLNEAYCSRTCNEVADALDACERALREIAEECEGHPMYVSDGLSSLELDEVGGDAAHITSWAYTAREALAKLETAR